MDSKQVLDAVELWCRNAGMMMLRETGCATHGAVRPDAILLPLGRDAWTQKKQTFKGKHQSWFERPRVLAVEVKVSRQDFMAGIKKGQYERYRKETQGLYLAMPRGLLKQSEVPEGVGILVVRELKDVKWRERPAVCVRNPEYGPGEMDEETFWRIYWELQDAHREALYRERERVNRFQDRIGELLIGKARSTINRIVYEARKEMGL